MTNHPHITAAMMHERQKMLLAEAEAAGLARRARSARKTRLARQGVSPRPFRRTANLLPMAWSRLLSKRTPLPDWRS
jgi:hypothetical protein